MWLDQMLLPKLSIHDRQALCQQYLAHLYQHVKPVFPNTNTISDTYGEILFPSVNQLLAAVSHGDNDVFFDLGSGLGKVVLQVYLLTQMRAVYGIELMPALHAQALIAAARLERELPEFKQGNRQLKFILGDFLEVPLSAATILLIGSPCFTPTMLNALATLIENTHSIHTVLSLRPLLALRRLRFVRTLRIECSWDTALCYVYQPTINLQRL